MMGVLKNKMYRLEMEVLLPPPKQANVTRSFGVETKKDSTQTLDVWHQRLAHVNHGTIKKMEASGMVEGLILVGKDNKFCTGCAYGKIHRNPFLWNDPQMRSTLLGDLVHTDLCGSMWQISLGGARYFILFKDDAIGFRTIECIKTKTEQEVLGCLKQFIGRLQQETGNKLKTLRSD